MLYPQSLTDAKIIVKYKTEKDNATFFNDSKEVSLTGEWTNGQSIRYIHRLSFSVTAEDKQVETGFFGLFPETYCKLSIFDLHLSNQPKEHKRF